MPLILQVASAIPWSFLMISALVPSVYSVLFLTGLSNITTHTCNRFSDYNHGEVQGLHISAPQAKRLIQEMQGQRHPNDADILSVTPYVVNKNPLTSEASVLFFANLLKISRSKNTVCLGLSAHGTSSRWHRG